MATNEDEINDLLDERYQALFDNYGVGSSEAVIATKRLISNWVNTHPRRLRADATYFLLVSADHMLLRPYAGYIPGPNIELARFRGLSESELLTSIAEALPIILRTFEEPGEPVSAHDVMQAIDREWPELRKKFWWS